MKMAMALSVKVTNEEGEERLGFGCVKYTRGLGRKRIVISSNVGDESAGPAPLKRQCSGRLSDESDKSALESVPQDVLIRILCGVEHDDLKQLILVSKPIRDAALIAKQWHFAYKTPTKTRAFCNPTSLDHESDNFMAPVPLRNPKHRPCRRKLEEFATVLFDSP